MNNTNHLTNPAYKKLDESNSGTDYLISIKDWPALYETNQIEQPDRMRNEWKPITKNLPEEYKNNLT